MSGSFGFFIGDSGKGRSLRDPPLKIIVVVIERIIGVGVPLNLFSSTFFLHELLF
jgi:hypothetical protein